MLIDSLTFDVVAACQRKAGFRCICFRLFRCFVFVFFILPPNFSPYIVLTSNNNNNYKRSKELAYCANSDTRWRHCMIYLYKQIWVHSYICTFVRVRVQKYARMYTERKKYTLRDGQIKIQSRTDFTRHFPYIRYAHVALGPPNVSKAKRKLNSRWANAATEPNSPSTTNRTEQ